MLKVTWLFGMRSDKVFSCHTPNFAGVLQLDLGGPTSVICIGAFALIDYAQLLCKTQPDLDTFFKELTQETLGKMKDKGVMMYHTTVRTNGVV